VTEALVIQENKNITNSMTFRWNSINNLGNIHRVRKKNGPL